MALIEKDKVFCEKTGKHHRWKFKSHGLKNFPTTCVDCGMNAEKVQEGIEKQEKEAQAEVKKEEVETERKLKAEQKAEETRTNA